MHRERGGHLGREAIAVDGQRRAGRDARRLRRPHDQRAEPAHLLLEEADRVIELVAAERVAAHQFGAAGGLVHRGRLLRPHLVQDDADAARGDLPRRFAAGQPRPDDLDDGFHGIADQAPLRGALLRAAGRRVPPAPLRAPFFCGGPMRFPRLEQFLRLGDGDRRRVGALRQRRVRRPVGDVRTVAARQHLHRLLGAGPRAERVQHGARDALPAALLRLPEQLDGLIERDLEHRRFRIERAEVGVVLHVRRVAAEVGDDRLAVVGMQADLARQAQELERLVERQRRLAEQRLRQRGALRLRRLGALGALLRHLAQLHVRTVAAGQQVDLLGRRRVDAERARPFGLGVEEVDRLVDGEVGRRDVVGQRRGVAVAAFAARQERAEAADADADRQVRLRVGADVDGGIRDLIVGLGPLLEAGAAGRAAIELADEVERRPLAAGDLVEVLLHLRGEPEVDVVGEVRPQQARDRERGEARDQRLALPEHVAAAAGSS